MSFQLTYHLTCGWTFFWVCFDTPPNESSQGTIRYLSYLIVDFMRMGKFSDAHFTQQYAKTVHVHLEEIIKHKCVGLTSIT